VQRIGVYIDGFNLYFALKRLGWQRYYWLDVLALARGLLRANQELTVAKYFTARLTGASEKRKRQIDYLDALEGLQDLKILYGRYKREELNCDKCKHVTWVPKEKMTDVNIAVEIMRDLFQDRWDRVILVSADADLVPPLRAVETLFPEKERMLVLPPDRECQELWQVCGIRLKLGEERLKRCQLPDPSPGKKGFPIARPDSWR